MLNGGASLDTPAVWASWPQDLPILLYHEEDRITDHKTTMRFAENVRAEDKQLEIIKVRDQSIFLGCFWNDLAKIQLRKSSFAA